MPYTTSVFTSWVSSYESWDSLKAWLMSEEGGLLRVVEPRDSPFALVRYTKGKSNFNLAHVPWCRSVVVEKSSRRPVSVAPPKANEVTDETVSSMLEQSVVAEELVDGTMLNVFNCNSVENGPFLATRSRLNANTQFYEGSTTFATMLDDALKAQNVSGLNELLPASVDGALSSFSSLVLMHPLNRIVKTVAAASFMLIHQGSVDANGNVTIDDMSSKFQWPVPSYNLDLIRAAKSVKSWVSEYAQKNGFSWQGLVLKDGQGLRWRVRSEVYETVRKIRGNESLMEERFARLRKTRTVDQYVAFFPEDRESVYEMEGRFRKNTRQLFHFYVDVFRKRSTKFYELPWPYKHHVSVLHTLFKDVLRQQSKKVDLDEVIRYTNSINLEDTVNMMKKHDLTLRVTEKPLSKTDGVAVQEVSSEEPVNPTQDVVQPVA
jgi:hypothetical protein